MENLKSQTSKPVFPSKKSPEERIGVLEAELLVWKKIATILTVSIKNLQKQMGLKGPILPVVTPEYDKKKKK